MNALTLRAPAVLGRNAIDQIFDAFFEDPSNLRRSTAGYPASDLYNDEKGNSVIELALAGFTKEQLTIEVRENTLTVVGESSGDKSPNGAYSRIARRSFQKQFTDYKNQLDLKSSEITFENGLLKIVIPQIKEKQPLLLKIK